jgi:transposase InsO family protein
LWTVASIQVAAEGDADVHESEREASPIDVRVHQGPSRQLQRAGDVSRARRGPEWVLRVAHASDFESGQEDARLLRLIRASFTASQGIYGAPRVFLDLREAGETCRKHRVARLMRENRLRALHGYRIRRWSVGKPAVLIPNLLQRQFTVTRPNKAWVTDITYIRTWQGWVDVALIMDLCSRRIVGWSAGATIHRELVLDAVLMAVRRRRPRGTLIHSDQGSQYGSDACPMAGGASAGPIDSSRACVGRGTAGTMPWPSRSLAA